MRMFTVRTYGCALGGDRLATTVRGHRSASGTFKRFFARAADVAGNYRATLTRMQAAVARIAALYG